MAILDTAGKFCSWGIGSVQARISKGGIFLKPFLAQIANASENGPGFQGMSELRNPDKAQPFQMPSALHKNRNWA